METAKAIATKLVEDKLAACVNILPNVTSIYTWQGEIHSDNEVILKIKSTSVLFDSVEKTIVALHPYDVPEIIALDLAKGNTAYLDWITASVEKQ